MVRDRRWATACPLLISLPPTDTLALAETLAWAALGLQRGGRDADRGSESPPAISPKVDPKKRR